MSYDGLVLLAFGGPHKAEDIRPFLRNVLAGRPVPPGRIEEVAHHYEQLGGSSPITKYTEAQAQALSEELARRGIELPVRVGMRHWSPWLKDALAAFRDEGKQRLLGLVMAAQETEASVARYSQAVEVARTELGDGVPTVDYVRGWGGTEGFIDANAAQIGATLESLSADARARVKLIFSAHSIPSPMAAESPYVQQLERVREGVCQRLGVSNSRLVYQSRSGNPRDPWLEPDICDALEEEKAAGTQTVVVAPIGFVCDHVEVLFDLDVEAKEKCDELGLEFHRAPTVGTHPAFIASLADAVQASFSE